MSLLGLAEVGQLSLLLSLDALAHAHVVGCLGLKDGGDCHLREERGGMRHRVALGGLHCMFMFSSMAGMMMAVAVGNSGGDEDGYDDGGGRCWDGIVYLGQLKVRIKSEANALAHLDRHGHIEVLVHQFHAVIAGQVADAHHILADVLEVSLRTSFCHYFLHACAEAVDRRLVGLR